MVCIAKHTFLLTGADVIQQNFHYNTSLTYIWRDPRKLRRCAFFLYTLPCFSITFPFIFLFFSFPFKNSRISDGLFYPRSNSLPFHSRTCSESELWLQGRYVFSFPADSLLTISARNLPPMPVTKAILRQIPSTPLPQTQDVLTLAIYTSGARIQSVIHIFLWWFRKNFLCKPDTERTRYILRTALSIDALYMEDVFLVEMFDNVLVQEKRSRTNIITGFYE